MANGHGKKPEDFKKQMEDNFKVAPSDYSHVKKVIGIVSGKGGVGKSLVTGLSATAMSKKGYKTAIMDADITGPSIPKMFGIGKANYADENQLLIPATTEGGIKIMSLNMLMDNETDPVVWRGPVIAGIVKQFWSDVNWGDVDFMFVDMPPGTGDVPLTVFQSLPVDGIIVAGQYLCDLLFCLFHSCIDPQNKGYDHGKDDRQDHHFITYCTVHIILILLKMNS